MKQGKTNTACFHLYVESKKAELRNRENSDSGGLGGGEMGDVSQRVQTSSSEMSKFWGLMDNVGILVNRTLLRSGKLQRRDLKCCCLKKTVILRGDRGIN